MKTIAILVLLCVACSSEPIGPDPTGGAGGSSQETGGGGHGAGGSGTGGTGGTAPGGGFESGSRLKTRTLVGNDGSRAPSGMYDSQLSTECSYAKASDGQLRCLPVGPQAAYYSNDTCTQPLVITTCEAPGFVLITDKCAQSRVFPIGSVQTNPQTIYQLLGEFCSDVPPNNVPAGTQYQTGAEMLASTFEKVAVEIGE